jgi:ribosomal protein L37AE/L43A
MKTLRAANTKRYRCPKCGSGEVRRSHMRGVLGRGLLKMMGVKAYRCESCDLRYYGSGGMETKRQKLD